MDLTKQIETLIEPALMAKGYAIVRTQISGTTRKVLQIMIERQDEVAIIVDDCAVVSRLVSVLLDQHDPIEGHYTLEVSSAGLERPLMKIEDYKRFKGHKIALKTTVGIEGQKKFHGIIQQIDNNNIILTIEAVNTENSKEVVVPFTDIRSAKLEIDFNATTKRK